MGAFKRHRWPGAEAAKASGLVCLRCGLRKRFVIGIKKTVTEYSWSPEKWFGVSSPPPCERPNDVPDPVVVEPVAETEEWTITVPTQGEAWTTITMPKGSTKRQAYDKAMNGEGIDWEYSWEFNEDDRAGLSATASGPGCEGEEVGDAADDEPEEDDE